MAIDNLKAADITISNINEDNIPQQTAVQGERSGRSLLLQITNGGTVENQSGVSVNLGWSHDTAKNSDGEKLQGLDSFQVVDRSQGIFRFDYPSNMMVPGRITAVIQLVSTSSDTRSKPFKIKVEGSPFDDEAAETDNSFTALQEALIKAESFSGGPVDTVNSESELKAKYPSGTTGPVVVLESDGKTGYMYTWTGTEWKKGVLYQEQGVKDLGIERDKIALGTVSESRLPYLPAVGKNGKNLFNKETITDNSVLDKYGYVADNPYPEIPFCVSDFITVAPSSTYRRTHQDTAYFYSKLGVPIGQISTGTTVTTPADCFYVRFTIRKAQLDQFMFSEGASALNYEEYQIYTDGSSIEKGSVDLKVLSEPVATLDIGKNLFDKTAITPNMYVSYLTGRISAVTNFWVSDWISVEGKSSYFKNDGASQQYAFYSDKNENSYISGQPSGNSITVPENAKFIRVTSSNTHLETFQLEKGTQFTGYEPFGAYITEKQMAPALIEKINNPVINGSGFKIQLPTQLFLTKNEEFQIHWRNVISNYEQARGQGISVRLQEKSGTTYTAVGEDVGSMWYWKPSTAGNQTFEIRLVNDKTQEIVDKKLLSVTISENLSSAASKTIVTVGDSFTDGYGISKYFHDFVSTDSNKNLNMIGLNDSGKTDVLDDAWSGYGYQWLYGTDRGYLRSDRPLSDAYWDVGWGENEANGWKTGQTFSDLSAEQKKHGYTKNEFFNPSTKKFDFSYYMNIYMNNQKVDAFVSLLGLNDSIWKDPVTLKTQLPDFKVRLDHIFSSVKDYNADIKILISLVTPQQFDDSFMNSYGITFLTSSRAKQAQEVWNQFILDNYDTEEWKGKGLTVMATNAHFDVEYGLISKMVKAVKFDQTVTKKVTNDVHPTPIGAQYIADTVRNYLNGVVF